MRLRAEVVCMTRSAAPRKRSGPITAEQPPVEAASEAVAQARPKQPAPRVRRAARASGTATPQTPACETPAVVEPSIIAADKASPHPAGEHDHATPPVPDRNRRRLVLAAVGVVCIGSAAVGLAQALAPHGPFRAASSSRRAHSLDGQSPPAAPAPVAVASVAAEDARPILADYRAPDRDEVSRAYVNAGALYRSEGLSGVVRQIQDCFGALKTTPGYAGLDYCVGLDLFGSALERKLADDQPQPADSFFAAAAGRDLTAAREVMGQDGDASARLLDLRRLAGEVSQAGPEEAQAAVKRASVANAVLADRAAQAEAHRRAEIQAALELSNKAAIQAAARAARANASVKLADAATSAPPPVVRSAALAPRPAAAPPIILGPPPVTPVASSGGTRPAPARKAVAVAAQTHVAAPLRIVVADRGAAHEPAVSVRRHADKAEPATRAVTLTRVQTHTAPRALPSVRAHVQTASITSSPDARHEEHHATHGPRHGGDHGAAVEHDRAQKRHASVRASHPPRPVRAPERHRLIRPEVTRASAHVANPAPTHHSLPRPLQALDRFFQRVVHHSSRPSGEAARHSSEPGSWVDCRHPRTGEEIQICRAVSSGDGTLDSQMRESATASDRR